MVRPTTSHRPSPLKILRAHVENKRDAVLGAADAWDPDHLDNSITTLERAVREWREARALLGQAVPD